MSTRNRKRWASLISQWQESGLTCREFARTAGVNPSTLAWWKWKLSTDGALGDQNGQTARGTARAPADEAVQFVELVRNVPTPSAGRDESRSALCVSVGRYRVEVPAGFDGPTLAQLLGVLEACS